MSLNSSGQTQNIGCAILQAPFSYLGSKVGVLISHIQSWNEIVNNVAARLSRWKMQTLSIGGRLTLIKSILGSLPIYHMSLFKVPLKVLRNMESIREKGDLGVSSLYALNRALLFKWIWRFHTHQSCLWTKVIKGIHGEDEILDKQFRNHHPSKMGNGEDTRFWEDKWRGDNSFKSIYPRVYALETHKFVTVAEKISQSDLMCSFRRAPRSSIEEAQYIQLMENLEGVNLVDLNDKWRWSLEGCGEFSIASIRKVIDDNVLSVVSSKTRWNQSKHSSLESETGRPSY
uniref:RNA-directed DNA polymerase, eukaryota, reverse transcriptase zinc-binding domain protein n=1 Tax=Tanacetum cinerariifolium TaxID=118510 RepID=A0A6L2MDB7_TANCI|nr:RNA-directed DNA polymerase, eukaryota, reverse transcriptase zinc-binding domain protein [Tanacetum cinerariifolium]